MSIVDDDIDTNPTDNPSIHDIVGAGLDRRRLLAAGGTAAALAFLGGFSALAPAAGAAPAAASATARPRRSGGPLLGFAAVAANTNDAITVPPGYTASVLFAWGDPVSNGPAFRFDASQWWWDQLLQGGMHHDGIHFFPIDGSSDRGLLAINHEYVDQGLLFPDGMANWSPDKMYKALMAHGVSVIEVRRNRRGWQVVRPSRFGRRITGDTPCDLSGPAVWSPLMQTAGDPSGTWVRGTLNNCGSGITPWGTFLTCEENFNGYFGWTGSLAPTAEETRYGLSRNGFGYRWHEVKARFDMSAPGQRNEPNRFGWIVEIDPYRPGKKPVKHTAMGRFKHEAAAVAETADGRAVVYSGDDEINNYVYKFVGDVPWRDAVAKRRSPLESGTLYVARFDAGAATGDGMGTGEWIALTPAHPALAGMTQAEICVFTRIAADRVGATKMDRPEWGAVAPDGSVYMTMTNNSTRGGAPPAPGTDEANPRRVNRYGHIIRWREDGDMDATTFEWDIFVLAGDPANPAGLDGGAGTPGLITTDNRFGSPDGLWADPDGRLWIQTDISVSRINAGEYVNIGNNQMLCADPSTGEIRRFLVGPKGCEVTGVHATPDGRTMFVDIQHPGEPSSEVTDPTRPQQFSNWPDFRPIGQGRPRSATVVITKDDGGIIGT